MTQDSIQDEVQDEVQDTLTEHPTTQHYYESIRAKLNKAIPERTELKFGTEVIANLIYEHEFGVVIWGDCVKCKKHKHLKDECYEEDDGCELLTCAEIQFGSEEEGFLTDLVEHKDIVEILGTPATLQEILVALTRKSKHLHADVRIEKSGLGTISVPVDVSETQVAYKIIYDYDLTKPVSEQSLGTLKSIDELL